MRRALRVLYCIVRCMSVDESIFTQPGRHIHFVGIGGVSMAQLAELLHTRGLKVTGSDAAESPRVAALRSLGLAVSPLHDGSLLANAMAVVRSAAIRDDNPEVLLAQARGIPVLARAELLGAIMRGYRRTVCVSGTHGKTTTTSMLAQIAQHAELDPTIFIGAKTPALPKGFRVGRSDVMVVESCEYHNSFLRFHPNISVILNIEADHLDFFKGLEDLQSAFRKFAELTPDDGALMVNADDANVLKTVKNLPCTAFGLSESADVRAQNIVWERSLPRFDVTVKGRQYAHLTLPVPGRHNLYNALAAVGIAALLGVPGPDAAAALADFRAAERRMEYKGQCNGADIIDDYAHHPTAAALTLEAVRGMGYRRVLLVYQPHTYSRTAALFQEFAAALSAADLVILPDIYAARETDDLGVSSGRLAAQIPNGRYIADFEEIADLLRAQARRGDAILTMGAGDVYKVGELLTRPS